MKTLKKRRKLIKLVIFVAILGIFNVKVYAQDLENKEIYEVQEINFLEQVEPMEYTQEELECLATVMYAEAGICDDIELYLVANVVINRVNDKSGEFKDSIIDVIYQKGQFTSVGSSNWNNGPTQREYEIAKDVLEGKRVIPSNVYWFSKKMNYGIKYYQSKWHFFSGMNL